MNDTTYTTLIYAIIVTVFLICIATMVIDYVKRKKIK